MFAYNYGEIGTVYGIRFLPLPQTRLEKLAEAAIARAFPHLLPRKSGPQDE